MQTTSTAPDVAPTAMANPVDVGTIRATIGQALTMGPVLPRHQEVGDLIADLGRHLRLLLSIVRITSRERVVTAQAELDRGPGEGLQSATFHAQLLALDCRWALRHLTTEGGSR